MCAWLVQKRQVSPGALKGSFWGYGWRSLTARQSSPGAAKGRNESVQGQPRELEYQHEGQLPHYLPPLFCVLYFTLSEVTR